ncbi:MAG: alpha/beta fold hydrolase [Betaproteobacteria bacterium]
MPDIGRLRYLEAEPRQPGPGPAGRPAGTLVLIHAFPLNARMWEPQLALAGKGWRVIAPQLRGFDGAAGDPPVSSIDDYAGDVVDLLDALHVEEAVIGGLSMGGYVTFALFRLAPRYFRGMVLADTRPQADSAEVADGRRQMQKLVRAEGASAVADAMLPRLLGVTTRRERPELEQHVRRLIETGSAQAIGGALEAMMSRPDSTPLLGTIRCPVLVVTGAEDMITPPSVAEDMHRAIPGAELAIVAAAGHLSSLEQPAAFTAALARFLAHRL